MDDEQRGRELSRINREIEALALGRRDEYRKSDGTIYRRHREPSGDVFEVVFADGGRASIPFTDDVRDFLVEIARTNDADELDDLIVRRAGYSPRALLNPPKAN